MNNGFSKHPLTRVVVVLAVLVAFSVPAWARPCCSVCENFPNPDHCYSICNDCFTLAECSGQASAGLPLDFAETLQQLDEAAGPDLEPAPAPEAESQDPATGQVAS